MSSKSKTNHFQRRQFIKSGLALSGIAAASALGAPRASAAASKSLDPVNPDIHFGTTGSIFGSWPNDGITRVGPLQSTDMAMMLADCKHFGLEGLEPYSGQVVQFIDKPLELRKMADDAGVTICGIGDLARRPGGRDTSSPASAGVVAPRPWLGEEGNTKLIADMVSFARDFLVPLGIDHWKTNMGARPPGGPSDDQLKRLADTLNEIGRQTSDFGVRLAPHPHIWGPLEREHDLRTVMSLTDPRYVWLTLDTGHNVLGGMDPVQIIDDYFPRLAEVHLKDTYVKYRGNTDTPTQAQHRESNLYGMLGSGGVDFPGIFKILRTRHFKGWAIFDMDAPRPGDGTGSVDDNLRVDVNYMRDVLHVNFPRPPATGLFKG